MATNSIKDPPDCQELEGIQNPSRNKQIPTAEPRTSQPTVAELKKRKQAYDKKSRAKKKQKEESKEEQVKTLGAELFRCEGEIGALKTYCLEPLKESKEILAQVAEKHAAQISKIWEVLEKSQLTCGSISATTDEVAYPPLELSVMAMSSNRLFTTESFKPCQSVPEEWAKLATGPSGRLIQAFYGLKEHYMASTVRNAEEIARLRQDMEVCHAEEIARLEVRHAEEIARLRQYLEVCHAEKEKWKKLADDLDPASFFVDDLDQEASYEGRDQ